MIITKPGVYELDNDAYHRDPCETPSLSAGMINQLLVAPAKCFYASQRLNPDWEEPEGAEKFSIGTVSHIIHLEESLYQEKVAVVPYDDWRKKEAKQMRDEAKASGRTPILEKHIIKVRAARSAFLRNTFTRDAFRDGKFEQSIFWRHPRYGFWCRCRPDFIASSLSHINDYKATANANPQHFGRHAYNMGYHRRAAWYLEGVGAIFGIRPKHYWFCNQEITIPYLTSVVELDYAALDDGQAENDLAASIFARCLKTNDWYGYRDPEHTHADKAFRVGIPSFSSAEIDERIRRSQKQYEGVE